jgi:hypothetical protein
MFKLLLMLWPALLPIIIYFFWVFVIEKLFLQNFFCKKTDIEGEKLVGEGSTEIKKIKVFSLQNQRFIAVLYSSLIVAIVLLINLGLSSN